MRLPCHVLAAVLLLLVAGPAAATEVIAFEVRIAGLRVADLVLTGAVAQGRYTAAATLSTTGAADVLRRVRFTARVEGRITPDGPHPDRYAETVDTGRREAEARLLRGSDGLRPETAETGDRAGAAAAAVGTIDPLTALWFGLADVAPDAACRYSATIFDGTRTAEVRLAPRPGGSGCAGSFRRLSGYSAAELAERRGFAFTLHHAPGPAGLLRVVRIEAETLYGKAVLNRR